MSRSKAFANGCIAISGVLLGVVPFGLVVGLAAADAGYSVLGALAFSVVMYAGAAQLAAVSVLAGGASALVAIGTALIINSRLTMYSAALAPGLAHEPLWMRALNAYPLSDQGFGVTFPRIRSGELKPSERLPFLAGTVWTMWIVWQISTVVGAMFGSLVPESIPVSFAVPLAFLGILKPNIVDRPSLAAALTAATVAVIAAPAPGHLGLPLAATSGIVVGTVLARRAGLEK